MDFAKEYGRYKELFDKYLTEVTNMVCSQDDKLLDAVKYALFCGGKRLRPVLFLAIYDFFLYHKTESQAGKEVSLKYDSDPQLIYPYQKVAEAKYSAKPLLLHSFDIRLVAVAIEMLHTYTLIHDDLPCLDNDDFRRGNPSCHKKYGEATALLAGDSLLNLSYELMFKAITTNSRVAVGAARFAELCGIGGLIGGQSAEMRLDESELKKQGYKEGSEKFFLNIYQNKTAALFEASATLAAVCCGCDEKTVYKIATFAQNFGMAFQLKDDLADMNPTSFAFIFGREKAQEYLNLYSKNALELAASLDYDFLVNFVNFEKYI